MKDKDLATQFVISPGAKEVLPPKAFDVDEPALPAWSPSEFEGVSVQEPVGHHTDSIQDAACGVIGLVVGLLAAWLKSLIANR